jgi:hypothetical protein
MINVAVIVFDMWDKHWNSEVNIRNVSLALKIDNFLTQFRSKDRIVIHSPSYCMKYYSTHPSRQRILSLPRIKQPKHIIQQGHKKLKYLPFTYHDPPNVTYPWKSQTSLINIDPKYDYISDNQMEVVNLLKTFDTHTIYYIGVHSNACILDKGNCSIINMLNMGFKTILISDLTDCIWDERYQSIISNWALANHLIITFYKKHICDVIQSKLLT